MGNLSREAASVAAAVSCGQLSGETESMAMSTKLTLSISGIPCSSPLCFIESSRMGALTGATAPQRVLPTPHFMTFPDLQQPGIAAGWRKMPSLQKWLAFHKTALSASAIGSQQVDWQRPALGLEFVNQERFLKTEPHTGSAAASQPALQPARWPLHSQSAGDAPRAASNQGRKLGTGCPQTATEGHLFAQRE